MKQRGYTSVLNIASIEAIVFEELLEVPAKPSRPLGQEEVLVANILRQGLMDSIGKATATTQGGKTHRNQCAARKRCTINEAANWVASDSADEWSFRWCCEMLGLEPSYVRSRAAEVHKGWGHAAQPRRKAA